MDGTSESVCAYFVVERRTVIKRAQFRPMISNSSKLAERGDWLGERRLS